MKLRDHAIDHEYNLRNSIVPRLYDVARAVFRTRGDAHLRYRLLMAIGEKSIFPLSTLPPIQSNSLRHSSARFARHSGGGLSGAAGFFRGGGPWGLDRRGRAPERVGENVDGPHEQEKNGGREITPGGHDSRQRQEKEEEAAANIAN